MIPVNVSFGSKTVSTMLLISLAGISCWCFVLWYEAKKDGFNTDKFFDLIFSSILVSGTVYYLLNRLIGWLEIYKPSNFLLTMDKEILLSMSVFLSTLFPIHFFSRKWKWSVFRILDIYSLGFSVLTMFLSLGYFLIGGRKEYLILFLFSLALYLFVLRYRGYRFLSGVMFSIFLLFISVIGFAFFKRGGYLLFYPALITISMFNLYLRGKKAMTKPSLPKGLVANLKQRLIKKERSLDKEQQQLIREDPYLQQGRDTDNAESMDEVAEDTGKSITDARLGMVRTIRIQVKKALAAIKLGRYGKCIVCGKPIDAARLKAYPEATTCIECATKASEVEEIQEEV